MKDGPGGGKKARRKERGGATSRHTQPLPPPADIMRAREVDEGCGDLFTDWLARLLRPPARPSGRLDDWSGRQSGHGGDAGSIVACVCMCETKHLGGLGAETRQGPDLSVRPSPSALPGATRPLLPPSPPWAAAVHSQLPLDLNRNCSSSRRSLLFPLFASPNVDPSLAIHSPFSPWSRTFIVPRPDTAGASPPPPSPASPTTTACADRCRHPPPSPSLSADPSLLPSLLFLHLSSPLSRPPMPWQTLPGRPPPLPPLAPSSVAAALLGSPPLAEPDKRPLTLPAPLPTAKAFHPSSAADEEDTSRRDNHPTMDTANGGQNATWLTPRERVRSTASQSDAPSPSFLVPSPPVLDSITRTPPPGSFEVDLQREWILARRSRWLDGCRQRAKPGVRPAGPAAALGALWVCSCAFSLPSSTPPCCQCSSSRLPPRARAIPRRLPSNGGGRAPVLLAMLWLRRSRVVSEGGDPCSLCVPSPFVAAPARLLHATLSLFGRRTARLHRPRPLLACLCPLGPRLFIRPGVDTRRLGSHRRRAGGTPAFQQRAGGGSLGPLCQRRRPDRLLRALSSPSPLLSSSPPLFLSGRHDVLWPLAPVPWMCLCNPNAYHLAPSLFPSPLVLGHPPAMDIDAPKPSTMLLRPPRGGGPSLAPVSTLSLPLSPCDDH